MNECRTYQLREQERVATDIEKRAIHRRGASNDRRRLKNSMTWVRNRSATRLWVPGRSRSCSRARVPPRLFLGIAGRQEHEGVTVHGVPLKIPFESSPVDRDPFDGDRLGAGNRRRHFRLHLALRLSERGSFQFSVHSASISPPLRGSRCLVARVLRARGGRAAQGRASGRA